jgi:two-component system, LuxR family, sensor kinase FixL
MTPGAAVWQDESLCRGGSSNPMNEQIESCEQSLARELSFTRALLDETAAVIESASDGIARLDLTGCYVAVNSACATFFGYTPDELVGKDFRRTVYPDDLPKALRIYEHMLADGKSEGEYRGIRKDGSTFYQHVVLVTAKDEFGRQAGHHSFTRDVTARKRIEDTLARHTAELARSNAELEQFACAISHDLRAPLRAVRELSRWIEEDLEGALGEQTKKHLELLRNRVERMDQMLMELLEYSRLSHEDGVDEPFDSAVLLEEIREVFERSSDFTISVSGDMPIVKGSAVQLHRVFMNLIDNAIKHHDRPAGSVRITASDLGACVEFNVIDDGPGIDKVHHERIFRMFHVLHPKDGARPGGMGLALVKKIVETHDGAIRVSSGPGRGSVFQFTWPKRSSA